DLAALQQAARDDVEHLRGVVAPVRDPLAQLGELLGRERRICARLGECPRLRGDLDTILVTTDRACGCDRPRRAPRSDRPLAAVGAACAVCAYMLYVHVPSSSSEDRQVRGGTLARDVCAPE